MQLTKAQRNGIVEKLAEVRESQTKLDKINKDLNEKVAKLKTLASVSGGNSQAVIDETLKILGAEVEKVGFAEE